MTVFSTPQNRIFHRAFAFTVEIAGFGWIGFKDVSEISLTVAAIEHWEGGALAPNIAPGRVTMPRVTLSRGATDDLDAWTWMKQVVDASAMVTEPNHERQVTVVQRDRAGNELQRWVLPNCWPTKWSAGKWDNNADENRIEQIELAARWPNLGGDNNI